MTRLPRITATTTAACGLALLLSGCKVGPNYQRPDTAMPASFSTDAPAMQTLDIAHWWTSFNDPALSQLIDRAAMTGLDLRLATARLREARALRGVTGADLFPDVNVGASYTRSKQSENAFDEFDFDFGSVPGAPSIPNFSSSSDPQDLYQVGFDANWEIDVFGGVRRSIEAADADIASAVEDRRNVMITLFAEVARNYVELRGFQRQIEISLRNLKSQQDTLELTQARFKANLISELDVTRADAQVATTAAQIPTLEAQRNQAAHRLAVLLGQHPGALLRELLGAAEVAAIPAGPPEVPAGLPSDLLRRRPDVRKAERDLAAATARVGVATADLFPRFSLTGSLGLQGQEFHDLGSLDSKFYSAGPSVSWPIFDAGRIRSNIQVQNALQEQALVTYEQSVLTALEDVENALIGYSKEQQRRTSLQRAVNANRRSVEMATQLYDRGLTDFLDVLDAQRALFISEDALVRSDSTVSTNLVALYKALGGGWQMDNAESGKENVAAK